MRLIDADAILKRAEESFKNAGLHVEDYRKFKKWLRKAPTVSEWIPVSERLPETHKEVLVYIPPRDGVRQQGIRIGYCDEFDPIQEDRDGENNFWGIKTFGSKWHVMGWGYYDEPIPTAWMPLPEPWKGGEEE